MGSVEVSVRAHGPRAAFLFGLLSLAACAAPAAGLPAPGLEGPAARPATVRSDPFEPLNRGLFGLGRAIDRAILRPLIGGYLRLAPGPLQHAVHNIVQNADEPVVLINDLLQARPAAAARTAVRFVVNTTVGVVGLFDPAGSHGLPHHDNGFGSTLGRYGLGPGPYFYLPLLGPTDLRDAVGAGVDYVSDPFAWHGFRSSGTVNTTRTVIGLMDERAQAEDDLQALDRGAVDPYATLRSVYLQSRESEIRGDDALPDLPELPEPEAMAPPDPTVPPPSAPQTP